MEDYFKNNNAWMRTINHVRLILEITLENSAD